jgi:hypothetical protein
MVSGSEATVAVLSTCAHCLDTEARRLDERIEAIVRAFVNP